jgi:hypothetical protein
VKKDGWSWDLPEGRSITFPVMGEKGEQVGIVTISQSQAQQLLELANM